MSAPADPALDHLAWLRETQHRFAAGLRDADPDAPVPSCAPWHVADLALHLTAVHWWAAGMAVGVDLDAPEPTQPRAREALVRAYTWSAAHLWDTLAALPPSSPARTLLGPGPAAFWRRRQLHETLVHLWDLDTASGSTRTDLPDEVWLDTVAEVVDTMQPRQVALGRMPALERGVDLVAPSAVLRLGPPGPAVAMVTGAPADLALLLWGRARPGERSLDAHGDVEHLARVLAHRLTP